MMVDGSIVIVENVDRMSRISKSSEPFIHLVARACVEVVRPIVFSISIIIIVFLPLFTLQGVEGKMFRPLASTLALAMFGSLIFGVLLAPVLSSLLMRRPKIKEPHGGEKQIWLLRWLSRLYRPLVTFFVGAGVDFDRYSNLSSVGVRVHSNASGGHHHPAAGDGAVDFHRREQADDHDC
jgi:cobalt-zinc-cadmium resistance protein CzcA